MRMWRHQPRLSPRRVLMGDPNAVALANLLWDINWESISWADCYKSAEAIIAAGWRAP